MKSFLKRLFVTYTKENSETGEIYSGRASGLINDDKELEDSAESILAKRDSSHHKNAEGFSEAGMDEFSFNSDAVRGREQMLIEHFGGAQSEGGTSGNKLNSISRKNKKREEYLESAKKIFGTIGILFLIFSFAYLILEL